jgi:predicted Rossmann fold flavoprotein
VLPSRFSPGLFVSATPRLAANLLKSWRLESIAEFFSADLRVPLVLEEETGKLFPASHRARDVRDALLREAVAGGVRLVRGARIVDLSKSSAGSLSAVAQDGKSFSAAAIVMATGGLSIPRTGSDGTGLEVARRLGHRIVDPYPALTPLRSSRAEHRALAGVSLPATLSVEGSGSSRPASASGGFLFTHFGYSGPSVLDISHHIVRDPGRAARICWTMASASDWERRLRDAPGNATVSGVIARFVPDRLAEILARDAGAGKPVRVSQLPRESRARLVENLTRMRLPVSGHEGYSRAEVTGGGISLDELHPATLQSRRVPGLFLCGEILDAFGPIGGHNFLWAWVTGRAAGLGAAKSALSAAGRSRR